MDNANIPVYKITVPITKTELTLSIRGDFHYGVDGVDLNDMLRILKREQDQHRGNQFVIYTGDLIENNLNSSIGHGYDMKIRDPHQQKVDMKNALVELHKHLHGPGFNKVHTTGDIKNILSVGVTGNHEYRSRNASGQWIEEEMYGPAKILNLRMNGIVELTIVNQKLKLSKLYRLFISHRPNKSNATSIESILRSVKKRKGDIPADVYIYGHFHRRLIHPDGMYNMYGEFKKVLYVLNPSPISYIEYADWSGLSPLSSGWYVNCRLPIDANRYPYGVV